MVILVDPPAPHTNIGPERKEFGNQKIPSQFQVNEVEVKIPLGFCSIHQTGVVKRVELSKMD